MKVKVLTYAQDGNTVVRPYMELKTLFQENQNIHQGREHEYGQVEIVFQRDNAFMVVAQVNKESIESRKSMILEAYSNWVKGFENEPFVKLVHIEFYKDLGIDTSHLVKLRNQHLEEIEERERARKAERIEEERKQAERILASVEENIVLLSAGKSITFSSLIEIIDFKKIKVHPRTKKVILDQPNYFEISTTQGRFNGKKNSSVQGVFEVVKRIANQNI